MASDIEVFGFVYDLAIVREWGRRVEAMKQLASENMIDKITVILFTCSYTEGYLVCMMT